MSQRAFELDFLPVGDGSKSGDAIALRTGFYESGQWKNQEVFIIDGGNKASGEALVKHVTEIYKTDYITRVILTHPDIDHASGLRTVVENLRVGRIWMHRPWNYWEDLQHSIIDGRVTKQSFGERLREAYQYSHDIEQIALRKSPQIPIFPPHQGSYYSTDERLITILGPSKELYLSLIEQSQKNPHMQGSLQPASRSYGTPKTLEFEDMTLDTEHLLESGGATSEENDMSLVLLLNVGKRILLTGDAGTMGLYNSIRYATANDFDLTTLDGFQVPHHGSRHNLSKGILENIRAGLSLISCSKNSDKHPSRVVTNALWRREMTPYWTHGQLLAWHSDCVPRREGYVTATAIQFENQVEVSSK